VPGDFPLIWDGENSVDKFAARDCVISLVNIEPGELILVN